MPRCNINQDFYIELLGQKPETTTQYYDKDIPNFMLEHRPSGATTWYYRYELLNGKIKFCRLGKNRHMDAVEARKQAYIAEMKVAEGKDPSSGGVLDIKEKTVFRSFAEEQYIPYIRLHKRTWQYDVYVLKKYIYPYFENENVCAINSLMLINWQTELFEKGLSFSSCNRIMALMRSIFTCLVQNDIIEKMQNPCLKVKNFAVPPARERYLSQKEVKKVLSYLDTVKQNNGAAFLKLLLFTGARKSEILKARWEYVDISAHILTVPLSKSGKARHIALSEEALSVIKSLQGNSKWLFPGHNKQNPMSCPYRLWKQLKQECGLENIRIHDLRHSYASFMVNNGCSLYEVQQVLGHSDPKMTQRYAHLDMKTILSAVNKTGKAICRE